MAAVLSKDFGRALCEHLGLPAERVGADMEMTISRDELFGVKVFIYLKADDLGAIGDLMRTKETIRGNAPSRPVIPMPTPAGRT